MKKAILTALVLISLAGLVFANGGQEDQAIIENLLRNTQSQYPTYVTGSSAKSSTTAGSEIISRDMATLERLYQYVEKNYLYEIDYDAVYEAMANALFDALGDKYSYYVKAKESKDYEDEITGTYGGLGLYFTKAYQQYQDPADETTLYPLITQVFPNTPGAKAGLRSGDLITLIDGEEIVGLEAMDCARLMKGTPGTTVELTIKRKTTTFTVMLTRDIINVPTVEYEMIKGSHTAYLGILEFSPNTYRAISQALADLSSQGMEKLIIDLRDNSGGDVDVALAIADLFIANSPLLSLSYKDPSRNITYFANATVTVSPDVEVAILTNGGTASAAEIFAATMKDNGRAVLFGTTTFGKGIMQIVSSFGTGYTSITTASFVGPSGTKIHEVGVEPDYVVEEAMVADEQVEAYSELLNSKVAEAFVDANPDYTEENLHKFAEENAATGIDEMILLLVARYEYLMKMDYNERPLVDLTYDFGCREAYRWLQENEIVPAAGAKVVNL